MIILQTVGLIGRVISSSQGLYLNTGQHIHRINTYQTSIPYVGFEPTIPASERAKTVHALDRWATVTGEMGIWKEKHIQRNVFQRGGRIRWDYTYVSFSVREGRSCQKDEVCDSVF
jgi:hypothetical protein